LEDKIKRLVDAIKEERQVNKQNIEILEDEKLNEQERSEQFEKKLLQVVDLYKKEKEKWEKQLLESQNQKGGGGHVNEEIVDDLKGQIAALEKKLQSQSLEEGNLIARNDEINSQLEEYKDKAIRFEKEFLNEKQNRDQLKVKVDRIVEATKKLKKEENDNLKRSGTNQDLLSALNNEIINLKEKLVESLSRAKEAQSRLQQIEDEKDNVVKQLQETRSRTLSSGDQLKTLNQQLSNAEDRERELNQQLSSLRNEISQKDGKISDLENKVRKVIEGLKNERDFEIRLQQSDNFLKEEKNKTRLLTAKVEELETKIKNVPKVQTQTQTQTQPQDNTQYQSKINMLEQQVDRLRNALVDAEERAERAEERVKQQSQQVQQTQSIPQVQVSPPSGGSTPPPPPMIPGGPPPPPPMGGPPPPPPPPPLLSGTPKLKINRTDQSKNINQQTEEISKPNGQQDLIESIKKGVTLKKTDGPLTGEKKLEKIKDEEPPNIFNIGSIVSDLAKQRALRVQEKSKQGIHYRQSMILDNLLDELKS